MGDFLKDATWLGLNTAFDTAISGWEGALQNMGVKALGIFEKISAKAIPELDLKIKDFTVLGSISYWDKIIGSMSSVNQSLGIAGNLGEGLKKTFQGAYSEVIKMGISSDEMAKTMNTFFSDTGRAQAMTSTEMSEMAKMAKVFGDESVDIITTYKSLGVGIIASTKSMRNLIKESDKYGVLPVKTAKILKDNITAIDKYSFQGGVKALEKMALYAARTNTSMSGALAMTDKLLEGGVEGAMEMSSELQLLGGEFATLGNAFDLTALSRNDPGKFQEMMYKAASSMATFNKETGELEYSRRALDTLGQVAKVTGYSVDQLTKGGRSLKTEMDLKDVLDPSLRGLKDFDAIVAKVAGSATRNPFGEWEVSINGAKKNVKNLSEEEIKGLSLTMEGKGPEESFERIATSNEKLVETMERFINTIKSEALSSAGYTDFSKALQTMSENTQSFMGGFIQQFKGLNEASTANLMKIMTPLSQGDVIGAGNAATGNFSEATKKAYEVAAVATNDAGIVMSNMLNNSGKYISASISYSFENATIGMKNMLYSWYNNTLGYAMGNQAKMDPYMSWEQYQPKYDAMFKGTAVQDYFGGSSTGNTGASLEDMKIIFDNTKVLSDNISNDANKPTEVKHLHVFERMNGEFIIKDPTSGSTRTLTDADMTVIANYLRSILEGANGGPTKSPY